eukprot:6205601-Pleurochrysis_carterae.AAC.2
MGCAVSNFYEGITTTAGANNETCAPWTPHVTISSFFNTRKHRYVQARRSGGRGRSLEQPEKSTGLTQHSTHSKRHHRERNTHHASSCSSTGLHSAASLQTLASCQRYLQDTAGGRCNQFSVVESTNEQDGADAVTPSTSPDGAAREKVARKISHAAEEALHAVQKNLSGDFEDAVPRVEQNALLAEPEEHERALLAEYADAEKLHKKACETIDELARRVRCCMRALFLAQTKLQGDAATPRPSEGLVAQLREQLFDLQSTNRALLAERMGHEPRRNRNYAWARATKFDIRERVRCRAIALRFPAQAKSREFADQQFEASILHVQQHASSA